MEKLSPFDHEIELKVIELVGSAAACAQMKRWDILAEKVEDALRWAYSMKSTNSMAA